MRVRHGLLLVALLMIPVAVAAGGTLSVEPNGVGSLMLEDGQGVIIKDLSGSGGSLEYAKEPIAEKKKKPGFEMVDETLDLQVLSGLSDYRACVMRKGGKRELDAAGIIPETWMLMKPRENGGGELVFRPLTDFRRRGGRQWTLYRQRTAPTREMIRLGASRARVGSYGYWSSVDTIYVWGVVDDLSEWGIGGVIPEPTTLALLCSGMGLLSLRRRCSR